MENHLETIQDWLAAVNAQDAERLVELSDSNIEIVGPRGSAYGHETLLQWLERAGLSLENQRIFVRGNRVVIAQHAVWRSVENAELVGEADVASEFTVENQKVVKYARYDTLDEALENAGLDYSDEKSNRTNHLDK